MLNDDNTNSTTVNDPNLALCASDLKLESLVPGSLSTNFRSGSSPSPHPYPFCEDFGFQKEFLS